ncbi:MAG: hypothetical protein RDV41_08835 [Planctomycetota bacterium]|nr:hypothetical protein [Planctomycetota bacterium]
MLRRIALVVFGVWLVLMGLLVHRYLAMPSESRSSRGSGDREPSGRGDVSADSESTVADPGPDNANEGADNASRGCPADGSVDTALLSAGKEKQRQFLEDELGRSMQILRTVSGGFTLARALVGICDDLAGSPAKLASIPRHEVRSALLAMEGLELLGADLGELAEQRFWAWGNETCRLVLLAGLARSKSVPADMLRAFLLRVSLDSQESESVRAAALRVIAGRSLSGQCIRELADYLASSRPGDAIWEDTCCVLTDHAGQEGKKAMRDLLAAATAGGDAEAKKRLEEWLTWSAYAEPPEALESLDILLLRFESCAAEERAETFGKIWIGLRRLGDDVPDEVVAGLRSLFVKNEDLQERKELFRLLRLIPSRPAMAEFMLDVLETGTDAGLRIMAADQLDACSERFRTEEMSAVRARLLRAYEQETVPEVRARLAFAVGRSGEVNTLSQLVTLYEKEPTEEARRRLISAVGAWGKTEVCPQLEMLFEREAAPAVRTEILMAMVASDFERGIMFMETAAAKEGNDSWRGAAEELRRRVK